MFWRSLRGLGIVAMALLLMGHEGTCHPRRVLVVGLDGGDWRYLQPLIDGGFVPTVADFQA